MHINLSQIRGKDLSLLTIRIKVSKKKKQN